MNAPQNTNLSLPQAITLAGQNFEKGETRACAYLCEKILEAAPNHGMALHLMGLVHHAEKHFDKAVAPLERALAVEPGNPLILANTVEIFRKEGHPTRALELAGDACDTANATSALLANVGLVKYDLKDLDGAKALHARALKLNPDHAASLNNLGSIARDEGSREDALGYYRQVLTLHPHHTEAWNNLITILIEMDDLETAQSEVTGLLKVYPNEPEAQRSQARLYLMRNELDAAEHAFKRALELDPNNLRSLVGLSQVLIEKNHPKLALPLAQSAHQLDPNDPLGAQQVAICLSGLEDNAGATAHYEKALALDPSFTPALLGRGHLALEHGDKDAARRDFEAAYRAKPQDVSCLVALVRLDKQSSAEGEDFKALEALLPQTPSYSAHRAASYHYALADCYHAQKRFDDAFAQYATAAEHKRGLIDYDADAYDARVDNIIAHFDATQIAALKPFALPSARPIFVLGMPRSGTTLTESILASHPEVYGAGELNDLNDALFGQNAQSTGLPQTIIAMLDKTGPNPLQAYLDRLDQINASTPHITDKMPANFLMIGAIHALLPNAKIIHVARDPMDSCFSGFTRLFERSQLHSYTLTEMGRYYLAYQRIMDHWAAVLPAGSFHTVQYEALVTDAEPNARALLDFAGLSWHDNCLEFHKSKRRIRTASVTQVREKIYQGSVAKWRSYEPHLGELAAVLKGRAL